jgi:hypothetical protein
MLLPSAIRAAHRLLLPIAVVGVVAACGAGAGSPASAPVSPVNPTAVVPAPSPNEAGTYWLRLTTSQAIPPLNQFANLDPVVITGDGIHVVPGAVPAIYPGPLVMPLFGQQVSDQGRATIMSWADELGLLTGKTDFTGGGGLPGGIMGHIELTVDGGRITLDGFPDATAADPAPGSPEAFGEFWRRVSSLSTTLGAELGPESPYTPPAYSILVGPAPVPEAGITPSIMDWPLDMPLATFGGPVANGTARCGNVSGADADTLRPALEQANQLTQWVQDPETSATFGLTVRPLVPGEDQCRAIFGPG